MTLVHGGLAQPAWTVEKAVVDDSGFSAFYESNWSDVAGFCGALTGSMSVGEDLAQEAFTRVCSRWRLLAEPRPYVFRVARNLARRHHRQAHSELLVDVLPDSSFDEPGVDPHLWDTVRRLPERLAVVVLLHYYADLPVRQVASVLHRPTGSVKRQLNEARTVLARTLGADHA
jgi:RNA polymerase sigma-70 factor (ECF subfamily)